VTNKPGDDAGTHDGAVEGLERLVRAHADAAVELDALEGEEAATDGDAPGEVLGLVVVCKAEDGVEELVREAQERRRGGRGGGRRRVDEDLQAGGDRVSGRRTSSRA